MLLDNFSTLSPIVTSRIWNYLPKEYKIDKCPEAERQERKLRISGVVSYLFSIIILIRNAKIIGMHKSQYLQTYLRKMILEAKCIYVSLRINFNIRKVTLEKLQ